MACSPLHFLAKNRFLNDMNKDKIQNILVRGGLKKTGLKEDIVRRALEGLTSEEILRFSLDEDIVPYAQTCGIDTTNSNLRGLILSYWLSLPTSPSGEPNTTPQPMIEQMIVQEMESSSTIVSEDLDLNNIRHTVANEFFLRINHISHRLNDIHSNNAICNSSLDGTGSVQLGAECDEFVQLLSVLFWVNSEMRLIFPYHDKEFHETGKLNVCKRLVALCSENIQFETNSASSTADVDSCGGLRVETQGMYFVAKQPKGPFCVQFLLVKDPQSHNSWCIRLMQWTLK